MNGFRTQQQASKREQLRDMKTQLANVEQASYISQAMIKQLLQNNQAMGEDLNRTLNLINELQYKILAMQSVGKFNIVEMTEVANNLRIKDFNEASVKQNTEEGLIVAFAVGSDSTITITSKALDASGNDCGIFRARTKLADLGIPSLIADLTGKSVGAKVSALLNGNNHEVELLSINDPLPKEVSTEGTATTTIDIPLNAISGV